MKRITNKRNGRILLMGLVIIVLIVATMCIFYVKILRETIQIETERYLNEVTEHVHAMIDYRIEVVYQALTGVADTYMRMSNMEEREKQRYLQNQALHCCFSGLYAVDTRGLGYTAPGQSMDLSSYEVVQRALEGENAVSASMIQSPLDGQEVVLCAVPLRQEGDVQGALVAFHDKQVIGQSLQVESFDGQGYSLIIAKNGDLIAAPDNQEPFGEADNFFQLFRAKAQADKGFSLQKMQQDIQSKQRGMLYFHWHNHPPIAMTYMPMELADWYLLSVVPVKVVGDRTQFFVYISIVINTVVVVLFGLFIVLFGTIFRRNQTRLEQIAFVDPVTEGMNHVHFEMEAEKAIQSALPNTYALVSMDIEKFKLINDAFGSEAGDRTLQHVYRVLQNHLFPGELAARDTADAFYLLLKNTGQKDIIARLDHMVEEINSFNQNLTRKYFLSFSQGVYMIDDPQLHMITMQDRANVARKNHEKLHVNRFSFCGFYQDRDRIRLVREKEIDNRMEEALANGEFMVYLQPKIELGHNTIAGAEALVRWKDPDKGLIPPDDFVPMMEKNGFIVQLDLYVFAEVCKLLRKWLNHTVTPIPIAVNLSRAHLSQPDFLLAYEKIHQQYAVPTSLLEIELTETMVFENLEALLKVIDQIHAIGYVCALDDFGSGYSSLNMLKEVPVDVLKLDRAFFNTRHHEDKRGQYVIESIIEMAKKLNMKTVSEGVETLAQVDFLRQAKCDMVQGYVFSKPLPMEQFERLLLNGSFRTIQA